EQLERALALEPDVATLFVGTNDVTAPRFDEATFAEDFEAMQVALRASGAEVLTFTLPDLAPVMPLARFVTARVGRMNDRIREISRGTGALVVDFARAPITSDPRLWSDDRIHANSLGHERMASALANALGLSGHDRWDDPLPPRDSTSFLGSARAEAAWMTRHFLPWIGRSLTGRTSGDDVSPKYPDLTLWDAS
ncbi:MAG: SGNH/GDSL hydrolase family protein, partial [Planctomycetota bacterium]